MNNTNQPNIKKMPCNFGYCNETTDSNIPTNRVVKYCELPNLSTINFNTYNEHHLRNILIGLNSDKPEIVETSNHLLTHYLEFRKTKPDDFVPHDSNFIMPTCDEIKEMMKNKIK
jgi:hypothetical protein